MRQSLSAFLVLGSALALGAQETDKRPAFQAASIRPAPGPAPGLPVSRIRQLPGGRFVATWTSVRELIHYAYGLQPYQEVEGQQPVLDERFDVTAVAGSDVAVTPRDEIGPFNLMLQALLADRFALAVRSETREKGVYALVRAREDGRLGSGLRPSQCVSRDKAATAGVGPESSTPPCGLTFTMNDTMRAGGISMRKFAQNLSMSMDRPVVDRTRIEGVFDVELKFNARDTPQARALAARLGVPSADQALSSQPSIFTAIRELLGLELRPERASIEVLVVEHVDRPTPN